MSSFVGRANCLLSVFPFWREVGTHAVSVKTSRPLSLFGYHLYIFALLTRYYIDRSLLRAVMHSNFKLLNNACISNCNVGSVCAFLQRTSSIYALCYVRVNSSGVWFVVRVITTGVVRTGSTTNV